VVIGIWVRRGVGRGGKGGRRTVPGGTQARNGSVGKGGKKHAKIHNGSLDSGRGKRAGSLMGPNTWKENQKTKRVDLLCPGKNTNKRREVKRGSRTGEMEEKINRIRKRLNGGKEGRGRQGVKKRGEVDEGMPEGVYEWISNHLI